MGANLSVTYGEMSQAASRLTDGQQQIEGQLADLKKLVESLVNGGYTTDKSSDAFNHSYLEFTKGASKTIEGLTGMSAYLHKAAETFQQADEQLAAALKG